MSSKSIPIILSYTVSKLGQFFVTQCSTGKLSITNNGQAQSKLP